jgi:hypothetical protein
VTEKGGWREGCQLAGEEEEEDGLCRRAGNGIRGNGNGRAEVQVGLGLTWCRERTHKAKVCGTHGSPPDASHRRAASKTMKNNSSVVFFSTINTIPSVL